MIKEMYFSGDVDKESMIELILKFYKCLIIRKYFILPQEESSLEFF